MDVGGVVKLLEEKMPPLKPLLAETLVIELTTVVLGEAEKLNNGAEDVVVGLSFAKEAPKERLLELEVEANEAAEVVVVVDIAELTEKLRAGSEDRDDEKTMEVGEGFDFARENANPDGVEAVLEVDTNDRVDPTVAVVGEEEITSFDSRVDSVEETVSDLVSFFAVACPNENL